MWRGFGTGMKHDSFMLRLKQFLLVKSFQFLVLLALIWTQELELISMIKILCQNQNAFCFRDAEIMRQKQLKKEAEKSGGTSGNGGGKSGK